jgi:AcrR family transcriptional regulator
MAPPKKARKRMRADRLGRDDWLDAAFDAVVEAGFDNVRVLVIADTLGVTRGSFYWHFADHSMLVSALIERWRARQVEADRALEALATDDPKADLLQLLDAAMARSGADFRDMRFELALRDLGRRDPAVARMLVELDDARRTLIEAKFRRLTGEPKAAADLAVLFYLTIAGAHQALSRPSSASRAADYIRGIIAEYMIARQARPAAQAAPPKRSVRLAT